MPTRIITMRYVLNRKKLFGNNKQKKIIGLLGGFHDAKTNTVYVSCFKALARLV